MRKYAIVLYTLSALTVSGCVQLEPEAPVEVAELDLMLGSTEADWLEPAISKSEAKTLKSTFNWSGAPLVAEQDPQNQHALRYALIAVKQKEQLEALDIMRIHWDILPIFPEEKVRWAGKRGLISAATDDEGTLYLYALMPAAVYNQLRAHAQKGEAIFDVVKLLDLPASMRNADGSVSHAALQAAQFVYRGNGSAVVAPSLAAVGATRLQPRFLGWLIRQIAEEIADLTKAIADGLQQIYGWTEEQIKGAVKLEVQVQLLNTDEKFDRSPNGQLIRQGWGARRGQPVRTPGLMVRVEQGLALSKAKTNQTGLASIYVVKNKTATICLDLESDAGRVTTFLLPVRVCSFQAARSYGANTYVEAKFKHRYANILAQFTDAWLYLKEVVGKTPSKVQVLVGSLANFLSPSMRAYAPCGGFFNWGTAAATELIATVGSILPGGTLAAWATEFLLSTDIIMPEDLPAQKSRVVPTHEYGHFALCDLMYSTSVFDFGAAWTDVIYETLTQQSTSGDNRTADSQASVINEGFADFLASQVAGGTDYYDFGDLNNDDIVDGDRSFGYAGSNYCRNTGSDCIEHNYNSRAAFHDALAAFTSLVTDVFDGQFVSGNVPGNGSAWNTDATGIVTDTSADAPHAFDDVITLRGAGVYDIIKRWSARANTLRVQPFHLAMVDVMRAANYNDSQICRVFRLHASDGRCASYLGLGADAEVDANGNLMAPVALKGTYPSKTRVRFTWKDISIAGVGTGYSYSVTKPGGTVVASGSLTYARSRTLDVTVPDDNLDYRISVRTLSGSRQSNAAALTAQRPSQGCQFDDICMCPAGPHIPECRDDFGSPGPGGPTHIP